MPEPDYLLPIDEVIRRVGLGRSTIYARIGAGTFPAPRKLGEHATAAVRWRSSDIDSWIDALPIADIRSAAGAA